LLAQKLEDRQLRIVFPHTKTMIEQNLRNGTGQFARLARALRTCPPAYFDVTGDVSQLFDMLQTTPTMYIDSRININQLITEALAPRCKQFKISNIDDFEPLWLAVVLAKRAPILRNLNIDVTNRMTRLQLAPTRMTPECARTFGNRDPVYHTPKTSFRTT
jgi:hypothetical protein